MLAIWILFSTAAFASYEADRDPPVPEAKKQYRLTLRTPGQKCSDWRKVTPDLPKDDMLVSSSKRDDGDKGCRFLWIVNPAAPPGPVKFELEPFGTKPKETYELAAPAGYQRPKEETPKSLPNIPGVANENGTGPAMVAPQGKLKLDGMGIDDVKPPAGK
jgi:hypothetical protein